MGETMRMGSVGEDRRALFSRHGRAAVAAIAASVAVTYPVDTVKTLVQLQATSRSLPVSSSITSLNRLTAASGLTGVYRGAFWTFSGQVPSLAVRFGTYQLMTSFFQDGRPFPGVSTSEALRAGALAGALEALVSTPFDLVKVRIQAAHRQSLMAMEGASVTSHIGRSAPTLAPSRATVQSGILQLTSAIPNRHAVQNWRPWSAALWASSPWEFRTMSNSGLVNAKDVAQLEGLAGLWRGLRVAVFRNSLYSAVLFSSWQLIDVGLFLLGRTTDAELDEKSRLASVVGPLPEWLRKSCAGGVAAGLASAITHPLATASNRLQAAVDPKHVRMERTLLRLTEPATWLQRIIGISSAHQTRRWSGIGLQTAQHSVGFFCLVAMYHAALMTR